MKKINLTEEEFREYRDEYFGFCTSCGELEEGGVEPDARGYECGSCEKNSVIGLEEALITGHINIT